MTTSDFVLVPGPQTPARARCARRTNRRAAALMAVPIGLLILWPVGHASAGQSRRHAQTRPRIIGATTVGHVLRAWSGHKRRGATLRYQWRRCNAKGRACKRIGVARRGRGDEYVLTRRDVGHRLRVTVIAHTASGATSSTSKPTRVIRAARATAHPAPAPGASGSPPAPTAPGSSARNITAYVTGYDVYDNTPPGSPVISNPVLHQVAGGTGTYQDPITVAVGHSIINGKDILDWPQATRFYFPNLRRYFIVEDTCGDGPDPQNGPCHNLSTADPGAQTWLDVWVDGSSMSSSAANNCESNITHNQLVIENPPSDYAVVPGPIAGSSCTQQYGNTVVPAGS
jgi:hypothetical protein